MMGSQGPGESATGEQQGCQARKERSQPNDLQVRAENKTKSCKMLSRNTEGAMASGDSAAEVGSATRMVGIDDGTETKLVDTEIGDSARPKTGRRADGPGQSHLKEIGPTNDARDHEVGLPVVTAAMMSTDVMNMQDETTADETLIGGG